MANGTSDLSAAATAWKDAVEAVVVAKESHRLARSDEARASCALSNALEAEKKAFAALMALRPEAKP